MNDLMKKLLGINWKTNLAGIATFLTTVPGFASAIQAWASHQAVDWRQLLVSIALAAVGGGLVSAKDSTTHSTLMQVETSSLPKPEAK